MNTWLAVPTLFCQHPEVPLLCWSVSYLAAPRALSAQQEPTRVMEMTTPHSSSQPTVPKEWVRPPQPRFALVYLLNVVLNLSGNPSIMWGNYRPELPWRPKVATWVTSFRGLHHMRRTEMALTIKKGGRNGS